MRKIEGDHAIFSFKYYRERGRIMEIDYKMTKYFRDSISARQKVKFSDKKFEIVCLEDIMTGQVDESYYRNLSKNIRKEGSSIDVVIVAKTLKTQFDVQEKKNTNRDEMTGIFYMPAALSVNGTLTPPTEKYPWIPREFLYPTIEEDLAVGHLIDFDEYLSAHFQRLKNNNRWDTYVNFSKGMYEVVTKSNLTDSTIGDIELEENVYLYVDDTINTTSSILALYDHLLESGIENCPLYQNFISLSFNDLQPLVSDSVTEMHIHTAQMGGDYPLSPSQRECVNHFNNMQVGDILAVNGPPGTGKTTLLQSLVANLYVDHALRKDKAPLIVASSTNNQAVTNIIESFAKIDSKWDSNLEKRWVNAVESFAVYFPSTSKMKEAKAKGYQYTDPRGGHFFEEIESEPNILASTDKFLNECNHYFGTQYTDITQCEGHIYDKLSELQEIKSTILSVFDHYERIAPHDICLSEYLQQLQEERNNWAERLEGIQNRVDEWMYHIRSMPLLDRLLSFLPAFKQRVTNRNQLFIHLDEDFLDASMTKNQIIALYSEKAKEARVKQKELAQQYDEVERLIQLFQTEMQRLIDLKLIDQSETTFTSLGQINEYLDTTIRYASFWFAVHYYECRWLQERRLTEKQKGKTFDNVLLQFYNNLSMVTPCFVMTFFQLPKLLLAYNNGKNHYLYNHIDLLIVDEAGQVTPEIAACSFSLAKRAVVVGDVYQIEPVWNMPSSLDKSLAIAAGAITSEDEFERLRKVGLNTSESSVMKVAGKSCKFQKYEDRGLFLSEHRRCYNEIVEYCNKLVYHGKLEPKRGLGKDNILENRLSIPPMYHIQVNSEQSSKRGGSRYNVNEAQEIAKWISDRFEEIKNVYLPEQYTKDDLESLIGVITPFKMQVGIIKRALPKELKSVVEVGTVHTFQGAERKIILMSTVYGKSETSFFIDTNKSLLNVAVSRAKDSFIVIGDINCLADTTSQPSGLLKNLLGKSS